MQSLYAAKSKLIQARLADFSAVPATEYFYELVYCLLTPQSSAVNAGKAVELLRHHDLLRNNFDVEPLLHQKEFYIRFHKTKAKRVIAARDQYPLIAKQLASGSPSEEIRQWLVENVTGYGWKESSHFLRNIGHRDLAILDRYKDNGVKTLPELQRDLGPVITAAIDADTAVMEGSVMDRLLAGAKMAVRLRKVDHAETDKSAEAIMARIEKAVKIGQLSDVLTLAKDLPARAKVPVADWLANVEARHAVDEAIAAVETGLKASLTGKRAEARDPAASDRIAPIIFDGDSRF